MKAKDKLEDMVGLFKAKWRDCSPGQDAAYDTDLAALLQQAREEEREACAKIVEQGWGFEPSIFEVATHFRFAFAAAIRQRKE